MAIEALSPIAWLPNSLFTKVTHGFGRESEAPDGSGVSLALIDELATIPGPLKDKMYALYSSGVDGYQGQTFSPKQLAAMAWYRNPYKPGDICHWIGGIRTDSGIIYGPRFPKKQQLFESLCDTLDLWNPKPLNSVNPSATNSIRDRLETTGAGHREFSNAELNTLLIANYAQFIYLLIHPFWNRNGRTSEELILLFSASNSTRKHVFHERTKRYTPTSASRMELINSLALEHLNGTLGKLGVEISAEHAETEGYKQILRSESDPLQKTVLTLLGPYLYRFASPLIRGNTLNAYFDLFETETESMIQLLSPENFNQLVNNPSALKLLAHHLSQGHGPR